ncbi:Alpha/beta fold hydrolase [Tenacibaculum sp. 190130A14a]|uniref:Alpha/beta fold hydrolase n=1 Tax=Tenacibaculum polynesiense TaxID=3137857 RepID=A0ABM9PBH7_9FLAO
MTYADFRNSQNFFNTPEGKIAYIDIGNKDDKVILLLHGIPTSGWLYRKMIAILSAKDYRIIAPDMLGFGNSDSPEGYHVYEEPKQAQRLLDLMDHLEINSWSHVFHDVGGLWTWELLKLAPHRVQHLIILNTIIYEEGFVPPMRFGKNLFTKLVMALYAFKFTNKLLIKNLFKMGLLHNNLSQNDLEGYQKPLLEGKNKAMYYFFSRTCHNLPSYKKLLPTLNIPTLVLWGNQDDFLKWKPQEHLVSKDLNIAPENIHILNAKHFVQEEKSKEICNFILAFIK